MFIMKLEINYNTNLESVIFTGFWAINLQSWLYPSYAWRATRAGKIIVNLSDYHTPLDAIYGVYP